MAKFTTETRFVFDVKRNIIGSRRKVKAAMNQVAEEMVEELKNVISEPWPPASVPGEAPHQRRGMSGGLMGSIEARSHGDKIIIEMAQHGQWLEKGQINGGGARPWISPTLLAKGMRQHWEARIAKLARGKK